ncbi:MAG: hypothetical protein GY862_24780, partial [Gammaproteobacteria bacterium]|nr:hypothetical protein [Gammaproteobacteria bacterium]
MDEFQKLLKEHIQRKGRHNISELAKEVGLTSAGFSKWLNGRVKHPDCGKVVRCAEVLGLTPEERRKFFKAVDCRENIVPAQPHFPAEASPVVGRAVLHPRQFFGQTEQLKRVKRAWRQAPPLQHVALIGPRGSGKTSFLHYLKNISLAPQAELRENQPQGWDVWRPDDFQFALVDFQDAAMCQVESLQRSILEQLNCNIPDSYRTIDFAGTMNNNIH